MEESVDCSGVSQTCHSNQRAWEAKPHPLHHIWIIAPHQSICYVFDVLPIAKKCLVRRSPVRAKTKDKLQV